LSDSQLEAPSRPTRSAQSDRLAGSDGSEPVHPRPATPVVEKPPRKLSNLTVRIMTASVLVPFILYTIYVGGLMYLAVVVGIVLLGLREFYTMIEAKGADPLVPWGLIGGALLPVVAFVGSEYHATLLMTAVLLGVMVAQLAEAQISEAMASISGTFFGVFYVGWLLSHAVVLREFHSVLEDRWGFAAAASVDPQAGAFFMVFCLTAVVLADAGAYFAGRAYGRRKLAPQISPSKTVEGALGGVVVGTLGALACKAIFDFFWPDLSGFFGYGFAALLAVILTVVGTVGDLVESLLKRDAAQKDAGALLPGMGGILDRIDSSLLAIPVMYYLLLAYTWLQVI
jgi:phosphatidate cytidylyltransferase